MSRSITINNTYHVIDSRDVIARIQELDDDRKSLADAVDEARAAMDDCPDTTDAVEHANDLARDLKRSLENLEEWDNENDAEELVALKALADNGEKIHDWKHGVTMIHEDYFTEYCQELVVDIGDLPNNIPGYLVIDWEATARNLVQDYTTLDFAGQTYYAR